MRNASIPLLIGAIFARQLAAHDLWLLPPKSAKAKDKATVSAISGIKFPKGEGAPDPAKFAARIAVDPDGASTEAEAAGTEGTAGLIAWTPAKDGIYAIAAKTNPKLITLEADAFNDYLLSDGLAPIYRLRKLEKTLKEPGVERYSKSPKVLVRVGDGRKGDATKPMGLPLEIVPLADPFAKKVGETLQVRAIFDGKALAGATLGWDHDVEGDDVVGTVRTDAKGEAYIPIGQLGLTTIRLTHMTRPKAKDYKWESFWTTLTFRTGE